MSEAETEYKCCFTGYRPSKLPFDIRNTESKEYKMFENAVIEEILKVCKAGCRTFYTGMAMGFDILAAEIVLLLKEAYNTPLKLVCVIPFEAQAQSFPPEWQERYYSILSKCDEKIIIEKDYHIYSYQERNKYMVDNCDFVLTWFDGKKGGTKNTIDYAFKKQRFIFNAFEEKSERFALQERIDL